MDAEQRIPPSAGVCPICASPFPAGATTCGVCGTPLVPRSAAPGAFTAAVPPPVWRGAPTLNAPPEHTPPQAGTRVCEWCGATSPAAAERCVACQAVFARPEQDEALRQASEARLRDALDGLENRRQRRMRRGIGKLFS